MPKACVKVQGMRWFVAALAFLMASGWITDARAQEHEAEEGHHRPNALGVFFGAATHLATDEHEAETGFAIGIEYTRSLTDRLKAGALAEWASTERSRDFVFLIPFLYRTVGELFLVVGPGIELVSGEHEEPAEVEFLARFGAVYEIELGRLVLGPQFNADVAGGKWTLVYGTTVGVAF
ncbi:MAG: hypothetical protein OEU54_01350 [Gemmatimonadota bacterium]|nr:hypothetical protein [Gemmatimonadota bacterium]